jgi:hypothetical protein
MKITEVVGIQELTVGTATSDAMILHPPERESIPPRKVQKIPQPGYSLRIGDRVIPTPGWLTSDSKGNIGDNVPS